ncbi:MAG: tail fiber protein [Bacteroidota bacterium]
MADPFLSEIKMMSFGFAPQGWALCNGQLLQINQNQALFSLLGTVYGGNGSVNFALPNLQGKAPIHRGAGFTQGQTGGEQNHTLTITEIPAHTHQLFATSAAPNSNNPTNNALANSAPAEMYRSVLGTGAIPAPGTIASAGGSQSHPNMQPYLVINFCIALQGIFPSPN